MVSATSAAADELPAPREVPRFGSRLKRYSREWQRAVDDVTACIEFFFELDFRHGLEGRPAILRPLVSCAAGDFNRVISAFVAYPDACCRFAAKYAHNIPCMLEYFEENWTRRVDAQIDMMRSVICYAAPYLELLAPDLLKTHPKEARALTKHCLHELVYDKKDIEKMVAIIPQPDRAHLDDLRPTTLSLLRLLSTLLLLQPGYNLDETAKFVVPEKWPRLFAHAEAGDGDGPDRIPNEDPLHDFAAPFAVLAARSKTAPSWRKTGEPKPTGVPTPKEVERACELPECSTIGRLGCSRCQLARYCSTDHQKLNWPVHRRLCIRPTHTQFEEVTIGASICTRIDWWTPLRMEINGNIFHPALLAAYAGFDAVYAKP